MTMRYYDPPLQSEKYLLYAMITGKPPGHDYAAYVKRHDQYPVFIISSWHLTRDQIVREVTEQEVLAQTPYILFYQKAAP